MPVAPCFTAVFHPTPYTYIVTQSPTLSLIQGNYRKAEGLYEDAIKIWEKALGKNDPQVAIGLSSLAELLKGQVIKVFLDGLHVR